MARKKDFQSPFHFLISLFVDTPESSGQRFRGSPLWRVATDNSCQGLLLIVASHPVAVPDILLGIEMPSSTVDRCHSLSSLFLPPAALASLPARYRYIVVYRSSLCPGRDAPAGNSCRRLLLVVTSHPVAVPDILLGIEMPSSTVDRCHSLSSLFLPPAALASLPAR